MQEAVAAADGLVIDLGDEAGGGAAGGGAAIKKVPWGSDRAGRGGGGRCATTAVQAYNVQEHGS
eukprot:5852722-Prymnesium_polylepis.1